MQVLTKFAISVGFGSFISHKKMILDTDSIMLGYAGEHLSDIVKPEMNESWKTVVKNWFSDNTERSKKTPGKKD